MVLLGVRCLCYKYCKMGLPPDSVDMLGPPWVRSDGITRAAKSELTKEEEIAKLKQKIAKLRCH